MNGFLDWRAGTTFTLNIAHVNAVACHFVLRAAIAAPGAFFAAVTVPEPAAVAAIESRRVRNALFWSRE